MYVETIIAAVFVGLLAWMAIILAIVTVVHA